jgi:putative lipoic acid-binding regulatory protein
VQLAARQLTRGEQARQATTHNAHINIFANTHRPGLTLPKPNPTQTYPKPTHAPCPQVNKYPCTRSFQAIGLADAGGAFKADMVKAVEGVVGPVHEECVSSRPSSGGKYTAVRIAAHVQNADQVRGGAVVGGPQTTSCWAPGSWKLEVVDSRLEAGRMHTHPSTRNRRSTTGGAGVCRNQGGRRRAPQVVHVRPLQGPGPAQGRVDPRRRFFTRSGGRRSLAVF